MKHADTFAVFDHNGDALAGPGSPEGIYHRDTRYLSHLYLTVDGHRPLLLSSTIRDDNAVLDLRPHQPRDRRPRGRAADRPGPRPHPPHPLPLERPRLRAAGDQQLRHRSRAASASRSTSPPTSPTSSRCAAPSAPAAATLHPPAVEADAVTLSYTGLDDRLRETRLQFEPAPTRLGPDRGRLRHRPRPGHPPDVLPRDPLRPRLRHPRPAPRLLRRPPRRPPQRCATRASRAASVSSSNEVFNESVRRSVSDLYMLVTETEHGPYPYAGIPWFSTYFGRDALITALQTLWLDPQIARGVLRHLAATQATEVDAAADAEPGKILHEMRFGEMAELQGGALRLLLRQRRLDAALRHPRRRLPRPHRRPRHRARALAQHRGGALLARGLRRPRRRRLHRVRPAERQRPDQPGLEGQPRLGLPRRRHARPRPGGAGRGAGLRLRRLARRRLDRPPAQAPRRGGGGDDPPRRRAPHPLRPAASGTRRSAPTCWRSTATSAPAGCAPRTPATRSSPASRFPRARRG